ncbi:MAG: hypothetical protein IKB02_01420, partial [Clostridia bacterium]|nr:hypothetical protein [Clostridia bacterium]
TIVFGTEPPASKTCNYTAHNTDDLYYAGKDAEGNNLYYHSCPLCGDAVNAKTFSEKTWTAATCTEPKICTICGESEGDVLDHNFTGAWSSDADGHWHVCANEGCNETDTKADHISSGDATEDAAEVCTECGYEIAPKLNHVHNYTVLNNDETNHWYECACGVADEATRVVHTGTDDNNCETEVKCSACNYVVVAAKTHDYTGAWSSDAEGHWHVCANDGCNVADTKIGHTDIEDDNDCTTAVKCSACEFVVIEAKAHDFDDATCTAPKTCTVCGTTEGEALDHDWDEGNVTTVASCTVPGVKTYTCKNDATHTYTEDLGIDENAHVYDDGFVTTNPTCMTAGEKTYTCLLNSEHKKYEPVDIDDDAHNFNTETLANDATGHWYACANEGCEVKNEFNAHISSGAATEETAEVCTVCGFEIAPKLDHVHNYNVLDKDATDHWYKCACGVADEATREAHAGTDDNNCATAVNCTCGYEITAAKSHDYTGEWVKDAEGHAHKCANEGCNETDTKVGHISGGAATEEAAEVCTVCGYEITPALEHSHNYTVLDKDETEHWYKCSCGAVDEGTRTAHTGTDDNNCESEVVCNVCGYTITASKTHDYTGAWNSDANGHWHVCANAGCTVTETKADHVYDNDADATCNDCGFEREVSGGDIGGGDDVGGGATGSNSQTITSIGGSVSIEVTATYKEGGTEIDETPIYSVIITWDDMTFEYNTATAEYVWNPDTLEYDEVESSNPGGWTEHQAKIYIENRSNAAVIVTAIWQPAEGVNASPVISKDSVKLDSAVGCVGTGKTAEIIVSNPTSGSITGSCTLGTIVLEIKADTSAE